METPTRLWADLAEALDQSSVPQYLLQALEALSVHSAPFQVL